MKRLTVQFSTGSAWTAVYVYWRDAKLHWLNHQLFSLGLDPTYAPGNYMRLFGSVGDWSWHLNLRTPVDFGDGMAHRGMMPIYLAFTTLQYGLDGRYGWLAQWRKRRASNVGQEAGNAHR